MRWVTMNISMTVMLAAKEVSFNMEIRELDRDGNAVRKAWGSTTCHMVCIQLIPTHTPASICPLGMDSMAARTVSAQ